MAPADGQLLLFVFLSSLTGAATLIQARRQRVVARMLAAPVSATHVVAGVTAGRWAIACFQGASIMIASGRGERARHRRGAGAGGARRRDAAARAVPRRHAHRRQGLTALLGLRGLRRVPTPQRLARRHRPQLAVLVAMAAALVLLGAWSLRRSLSRPM